MSKLKLRYSVSLKLNSILLEGNVSFFNMRQVEADCTDRNQTFCIS